MNTTIELTCNIFHSNIGNVKIDERERKRQRAHHANLYNIIYIDFCHHFLKKPFDIIRFDIVIFF